MTASATSPIDLTLDEARIAWISFDLPGEKVNKLSTAVAARLAEDGLRAERVGWHPSALRLPAGSRPSLHWTFLAGLCQVQEEASLLPVRLLDPQPGERVLDLCAAPGGKAAQMAVAVGARGTLVANDPALML